MALVEAGAVNPSDMFPIVIAALLVILLALVALLVMVLLA